MSKDKKKKKIVSETIENPKKEKKEKKRKLNEESIEKSNKKKKEIVEKPKEEKIEKQNKFVIGSSFGFDWNEKTEQPQETIEEKEEEEEESDVEENEENDSNNEEEINKKQSQNLKKKEKKITEESIVQRENELLKKTKPETENDYERLVIESPNSSYLWIQYMAFKLYLTDIDGAREIGKRALKKINFKEEDEKFNIYSSLINLENKFGNQKTQEKILNEALLYCNKKRVYIQQAQICAKNGQEEKAIEFFEKLIKKFPESRKGWESYILHFMENKDFKKSNEILQKSLQKLPKHKHLRTITRYAIHHYKHGSIIDGHKIFQGILNSYPSRTDLWSIFIDVEMNAKRYDEVRNIFERCVNLKLSTKKMKKFLQRYLKFEKEHGNEKTQEHVKQIAKNYVEMKTN